jgi:outer membrane protein assembly factor BamB
MDLTDYHRSSPFIDGNIAYYGDDLGNLNGVDIATGSLAFQYTTESERPIRSTPIAKSGVVYFGDWEGEVYAVSIADKKLLWQHTPENSRPYYGAIVSEFVIHEGVLYFGSQHDIFTPLDLATGKPVWKFIDANQTYLPSTPFIHNGNVIIASTIRTNAVLCLNRGDIVWSFKSAGVFFTKPVLKDSVLIINSTNFGKTGYLYLLDVNSGKQINKVPIEKASPSAPAVFGDKVYLGAGDGCIYALKYSELITPAAVAR